MTSAGQPAIKAVLTAAITRAMKQRDRTATAVYRSALGAIDNAEAVDTEHGIGAIESSPVGLASAEVPRRVLSDQDMIDIVVAEADERTAAAAQVQTTDPARAGRLRDEAALLLDLVGSPRLSAVDAADLDLADVVDLYASVGWTAYTSRPDVLAAALAGSSHLVVARLDGVLVGLARVVSDSATVAYVQDVLVRPDRHRLGIGAALVREVLRPYEHVRQKVLLTDDDPALRAFYTALGWTAVEPGAGASLCAFVRFDA